MQEIKPGKYQHYKGVLAGDGSKMYEVLGVARHSETLEGLVVYKNLPPIFSMTSFCPIPAANISKLLDVALAMPCRFSIFSLTMELK